MKRGPLIGLTGPIGSGKDTLALALIQALDYAVRIKFADKLYDMAAAFDPAFSPDMSHAQKDGWVLDNPLLGTRRNFLQQLGTSFGRETVHEDVWVMATQAKINAIWEDDPTTLVVISDARSTATGNEEAYIREHGILVHLRPDWHGGYSGTGHPTERGIEPKGDDVVLYLKSGKIQEGVDALLEILVALVDG